MINACISCSSEEQGKSSWEMSVGLDTARVQFQGWDWDQYNSSSTNPMLLPRHCHHQQQQHSDSEEQKPVIMTPTSYREYNGMGFSQSALNVLHSSGVRSFGGPNDGIPSSPFHPNLLYSGMCGGLGSNYGSDARSHHHAEQQRQLIGMMNGMEQQYEKGTALVKREEGDFQARIGLNLGHRTYFSSEDMTAVSRLYKRPRAIPPGSVQVPRCQAEGCKADLSNAKHYHRRHKVCELHSKATSVVTAGLQQRFCQQCSRFHVLAEFDEVKRSCRKRLADHNRRRRKPQPNVASSSCTAAENAALKVEDEKNNNGSGGLQATPILRTEAQALLNAISISSSQLPSMLHTGSKGQIPPTVLQAKAQKLVPGQQYTQSGPNLSLSSVGGAMGLCNQRQATTHEDYNGLELALPWLRPCTNSEFNGSTPRPPVDILQPIISEKSDGQVVEAHANFNSSSCIQNFIPLTAASSRELGSSQWMVGGNDDPHQMFSLLEAPALRTAQDSSQRSQSRPVEYLSHHHQNQHQGGMNSNESVDGQSDAKFSEMESLRVPFGQSVYDDNL